MSMASARLRVLMAATSYPAGPSDWKGRFIHDLAAGLDRSGRVQLELWAPPGDLPGAVGSACGLDEARWLRELMESGGIAHLLRRRPLAGLRRARGILSRLGAACIRRPADLYHVNWMQLALGLPNDARPAYVSVLGTDFGLLRVPGMTPLLRRAFRSRPTLLAPNAGWMADELRMRFGRVAEVMPNPFGVDPAWFDLHPVPAGSRKWLVVSRITRNKLGDLVAWGEGMFGDGRQLILLGPVQEEIALPQWVEAKGATHPSELRGKWFPNAAGLLTLSRHDEGRPQVLIEAMAAGLPVIASRLAAHTDLIRHGETGWIVDSREQLLEALRQAEDPTCAARVGTAAKAWVRERVGTWDDCARRCVDGYEALLEKAGRHGT